MFVVNSKGEKEPFSAQKVERSARRAGASLKVSQDIARQIERQSFPGITTGEIFQKVKKFLEINNPAFGIKFSLKQAMKDLGPTGFQFEKYAAAILKRMGYKVKLNQFISGKCLAKYEIDFTAEKEKTLRIGECKYHSQAGMAVDQEVALANYARFLDIKNSRFCQQREAGGWRVSGILITNTRFSTRAIKYSRCAGIELWGWKHPSHNGLEVFIDQEKLYPITILPSFKRHWAEVFNQNDIILVHDLLEKDLGKLSEQCHILLPELQKVVEEAQLLLNGKV